MGHATDRARLTSPACERDRGIHGAGNALGICAYVACALHHVLPFRGADRRHDHRVTVERRDPVVAAAPITIAAPPMNRSSVISFVLSRGTAPNRCRQVSVAAPSGSSSLAGLAQDSVLRGRECLSAGHLNRTMLRVANCRELQKATCGQLYLSRQRSARRAAGRSCAPHRWLNGRFITTAAKPQPVTQGFLLIGR